MKKDWLNQKLPDKLQDYASPLHTGKAWERLANARQQQQRKKRRFFLFWLSGMIGLFLIGSLVTWNVFSTDHQPTQAVNENTPTIPTTSTTISNQETASSFSKPQSPAAPANQLPATTKMATTQPVVTLESKKTASGTSVKNNSAGSTVPPITHEQFKTSLQTNDPLLSAIDFRHPKTTTTSQENLDDPSVKRSLDQVATQVITPLLPSLPYSVLASADPPTPSLTLRPNQSITKPQTPRWWLGVQSSYSTHEINWSGSDHQTDYLNRRAAAEKGLESWELRFQVRRQLGAKLFLESGLHGRLAVSRFNDQYQWDSTGTAMIPAAQVIEYLNGNRDSIAGTGTIQYLETGDVQVYNRYYQVTLPLYLGWQTQLSERVGMTIAAGPVISLFQTATGRTFADAQTAGTYTQLADLPYRSFAIRQADAQMGLTYRLGNRVMLQGGLQASWQWGSPFKSSLNYRERHQRYGGFVGIGWSL